MLVILFLLSGIYLFLSHCSTTDCEKYEYNVTNLFSSINLCYDIKCNVDHIAYIDGVYDQGCGVGLKKSGSDSLHSEKLRLQPKPQNPSDSDSATLSMTCWCRRFMTQLMNSQPRKLKYLGWCQVGMISVRTSIKQPVKHS